jgi:hypothetical protein
MFALPPPASKRFTVCHATGEHGNHSPAALGSLDFISSSQIGLSTDKMTGMTSAH